MELNLFPILFLASLYFLIFCNVHILLFYSNIFISKREKNLPVFPTNLSLLHICLCSLITINCIKIPPRSPARDLGEMPGISLSLTHLNILQSVHLSPLLPLTLIQAWSPFTNLLVSGQVLFSISPQSELSEMQYHSLASSPSALLCPL